MQKISNESDRTSIIPTSQALVDLHSLFTSIIKKFSVNSQRNIFLDIFKTPLKMPGIKMSSAKLGIFHAMLDLVSDLMHNNDLPKPKTTENDMAAINFYHWDAQNEEQSSFANFPRDEKFERIFIVLDLLVRVMEDDLAHFLIKYSNKLQSSIQSPDTSPLIVSLLWPKHDRISSINAKVKSIVDIFIKMIALNYPTAKIQIMSRLVNLITHIINLYQYADSKLDYPGFAASSQDLVNEIHKSVEESPHYSMSLVIKVTENLRAPLSRMLFSTKVLGMIHKKTDPISLSFTFEIINKKRFLNFENFERPAPLVGEPKYPRYDRKLEPDPFDVNQKEYLKLLKAYTASICDFYHLKTAHTAIYNPKEVEKEDKLEINSFNFSKLEKMAKEADMSEQVQLRTIDLSYKKIFYIKMEMDDCNFYIRQMRYLSLLARLLSTPQGNCERKLASLTQLLEGVKC